jgi:hypothetical protein
VLAAAFAVAGALSFEKSARADEPLKPSEPSLMEEPGEVVDVVDAFDTKNNDPFDLHLSLGFHQTWERGKIRRESNIGPDGQPSNAGFTQNIENIASYKHTTSTLNMRADIGLYKDLGLFIRLPLILADDRSLDDLDGSAKGVNAQFGRAADPATGDPLFKLPFTSPTRSGIDYIAAGLRWSVFNQYRDPTKPTWTWEVEGRFGVGEPLHACNANPETVPTAAGGNGSQKYPQCPGLNSDPSKQPIYGSANPNDPFNATPPAGAGRYYRNPNLEGRSPGISRGTNAIKIGTMFANRFRYVEPYGGFWFMAEWQKSNTDMGNYGDLQGIITNRPPLQGGLIGGLMVHPWENREQFQRFTIDLRFDARYISQGRDYTPLFDALGSSNASSLVAPNPARYQASTDKDGKPISVGNYKNPIAFTGVTDVEAHGAFGGKVAFVVQAAKYIRFNLGVGLTYEQSHLVSTADACNPDFTPSDGEAGRCRGSGGVTGTPNPNHRPAIDLPGRRFRVTETFLWDAWVSGSVMF